MTAPAVIALNAALSGRVCLVSGAGQGIGREIAFRFARQGARGIVVNDYYPERAERVAEELRGIGAQALAAAADVSDPDSVVDMIAEVGRRFGGVDVLVNNAGNRGPQQLTALPRAFWETDPSDWPAWMSTNFFGVLNMCRFVLPHMVERGHGRLITIISEAGRVGEGRLVAYSGAKAGAAGAMRAIAREVAAHGITANCVSIAATRTPGVVEQLTPEREAKMVRAYPVGRLGQPSDVAAAVGFLASDEAGWITGQTYPVNGGYSFST